MPTISSQLYDWIKTNCKPGDRLTSLEVLDKVGLREVGQGSASGFFSRMVKAGVLKVIGVHNRKYQYEVVDLTIPLRIQTEFNSPTSRTRLNDGPHVFPRLDQLTDMADLRDALLELAVKVEEMMAAVK